MNARRQSGLLGLLWPIFFVTSNGYFDHMGASVIIGIGYLMILPILCHEFYRLLHLHLPFRCHEGDEAGNSEVCPHGVFRPNEGKSELFDRNSCMECGVCEKNCPAGAIEVNAGVGCASTVIKGILRGTEPTCDCSGELGGSCC